jgi:PhnB protein
MTRPFFIYARCGVTRSVAFFAHAACCDFAFSIPQERVMSSVKPIPEGYHSITPYLCIKDAAKALDFYKEAFGAQELFRMAQPDGRIGHAEIQIGDSRLMIADECPDMEFRSPQTYGGSPVGIHLYVEDVDATVNMALVAGAKLVKQVNDQFYGDRNGTVEDPFGHRWFISTHIEDLSQEEICIRLEAQRAAGGTNA